MFEKAIKTIDACSDQFFVMMDRTLTVSKWPLWMRRVFLFTFFISGPLWFLWAVTCFVIVAVAVLAFVTMGKIDQHLNAGMV